MVEARGPSPRSCDRCRVFSNRATMVSQVGFTPAKLSIGLEQLLGVETTGGAGGGGGVLGRGKS